MLTSTICTKNKPMKTQLLGFRMDGWGSQKLPLGIGLCIMTATRIMMIECSGDFCSEAGDGGDDKDNGGRRYDGTSDRGQSTIGERAEDRS